MIFPSPVGISLTNIPAGDGKIFNLFLQCISYLTKQNFCVVPSLDRLPPIVGIIVLPKNIE
jgi:hypothetical protein